MSITGKVLFSPTIKDTGTGLGTLSHLVNLTLLSWDITDGTGANQSDRLFTKEQASLAIASTDSFDLFGTLEDAFGNVVQFADVKMIALQALPANVDTITIKGTFSSYLEGITPGVIIQPGGLFVIADKTTGYAVTDGPNDLLDIVNNSGSNTAGYNLIVLGTSA